MCEFWAKGYGFDTTYSCIEAVSIAHTVGRPVVAAEAFTSDDKEAWRLYPGAMKRQADWAFCLGINRLVFHRYAHQPWLNRRPGMTMGPYGVHYERTQTWWPLVGAWHQYLARCQAVLQRGLPVADICYLAPEGAPHVFRPPASALRGPKPLLDRKGYNFDGCAPETLLAGATVKNRQLVLPAGATYRVLVLPEMDTMTPALLRKIRDLVKAGATVIGPRPDKSPSLSNYPACDQEVQRLAAELWGPASSASNPIVERRVGKGRLVAVKANEPDANRQKYPDLYCSYDAVADMLGKTGVPPDFESDVDLRYLHRRDGGTDIYFVATAADHPVSAECSFRVIGKHAEIWDPVTGATRAATPPEEKDRRTQLRLALEPGGSAFVVFRQAGRREKAAAAANSERKRDALPVQTPVEIRGPWEVRFESGRGAPEKITMEELLDWSRHPDPGVKFFSGQAVYRTTFSLDLKSEIQDLRWMLDLGQVQVMARVKLNGQDLGVLWAPPFAVEITPAVRPGTNTLEIAVANLWPNRLIGDQSLPPEQRVTWTTWNPFQKDTPLLPSGLLGPVCCRLISPE
jgi:hypothetical protein